MKPNILLFMPDQLRADWVGPSNRGKANTPAIDALMARGVTFRNAICPSPICGPSRASLATGFEYDRCTVPNNRHSVGLDEPNFYRQLAAAGYQVLTCGKLDLLKGELDWGSDGQHAEGGVSRLRQLGFTGGLDSAGKHAVTFAYNAGKPEPYLDFLRARGLADAHIADFRTRNNPALGPNALGHPGAGRNFRNTAPSPLPDDAYQDDWIGGCGRDLIEQASGKGAPWFLQVNFAGPHEPMNVTEAMAAGVAGRDPPLPRGTGALPDAEHQAIRRNYTAMVEHLDRVLAGYMDLLERTGQRDNTVVIVTSDHGEMLGDCDLWEKFVPHQPSIGIPLIVAGPGVARGRTTDQPVTFLDLHATISEIAGAAPIAGIDSRSMLPTLADPGRRHRELVFSGLGTWRIVFDGHYKLIAGYDPAVTRQAMETGSFDPAAIARARLVDTSLADCETGDISAGHPEIARRLAAAMRENCNRARARAAPQPAE